MQYNICLPVTVGQKNLGMLTLKVGYEPSFDFEIETLGSWKNKTVPQSRQKGLFKLNGGRSMTNGKFFDVIKPLSVPLRNKLQNITAPVALVPDEGFSALMLDELCSCFYNGAHIQVDGNWIPFSSHYRLCFPMFKILEVLSFEATDLTFERINNNYQNGGL